MEKTRSMDVSDVIRELVQKKKIAPDLSLTPTLELSRPKKIDRHNNPRKMV